MSYMHASFTQVVGKDIACRGFGVLSILRVFPLLSFFSAGMPLEIKRQRFFQKRLIPAKGLFVVI
jgi:hypothetical protein